MTIIQPRPGFVLSEMAAGRLRRMRDDFEYYANNVLHIRDKQSQALTPFRFNAAQRLIHETAERQLAETGRVRINLVKARQQGASTYILGRGYHRATLRPPASVRIVSHEVGSAQYLFGQVQNFHDQAPPPLRATATTDQAKSLAFGRIGSFYTIATARTRASGRSLNFQFLHGSEVAFWPALHQNLAALIPAVPSAPGTEVFFESTANGANEFKTRVMASVKGVGDETSGSDYLTLFLPWFLSPEYSRKVPKGFDMEAEDWEYCEAYGLTLEQMAWRAFTIRDSCGSDPTFFDQEYPASLARAFRRSATENPFIPVRVTEAARKRPPPPPTGAKILSFDPSEGGPGDRFAVIERDAVAVRWKHALKLATDDTEIQAHAVAKIITERDPDATFIDRIGWGAGICDRVCRLLPGRKIIGVKASEASIDERYANKRAEMWGGCKDWLMNGGVLLDDDELETDLNCPGYGFKGEAYLLESKKSIKRRQAPSPDFGDALSNSFYLPVAVAMRQPAESLRSGANQFNWKTA